MLLKKYIVNIVKFVFVASSLILISCTKESDTGFNVDGKLDHLAGTTIYAVKEFSQDSLVIDTILVNKDGKFNLKGDIVSPTSVSLFYTDSFPPLRFFVDKNYSVKIEGDVTRPASIEVKGGEINDDLQNFRKKNQNLLQARDRAFAKKEHFDPAELKNINIQLARLVREYVESNPTKLASVILMKEYSVGNITPEMLGEDIASLQGAAAEFYQTTLLKDYYERVKSSMKGSVAPEIELKSTKGEKIKLSDFKGKPVLLVFDLKESPANSSYFTNLKAAQKDLKGKVNFISIVIDEDPDSPDPEIIKIANSLDWTVLLDSKKWSSKEVKKYNIISAPYMILVSPEGTILERDVSIDSLVTVYKEQ